MKFSVTNGCFRYPHGERQVLKDLSYSVESGKILAILGANGAGKTTLLRCSLGLLRWESGESRLDGENIADMSSRKLWRNIAYVPQARQSATSSTVEEMILLGRSSHISPFRAPTNYDMKIVNATMERLHLEALRKRRCSELSGGELQMALIARALSTEPKLLVLDEPESNLDFRNQLLVLDTLSESANSGMACLFNTHYPAHALRRAHTALMLGRDGHFRCGATADIVTEQNIAEFFGVHAVIGDIETQGNQYADVVALRIAESIPSAEDAHGVAVLSVVMQDRSQTEAVNRLLHTVAPWVLGRMGLPHPERELYIIGVTLDAPYSAVRRLMGELNLLRGIRAKVTYEKDWKQEE